MTKDNFFVEQLLAWHSGIERPLPWKGSKDPYKIWLSEIILQQTRAEQGLPYYEKFVQQYPRIQDLAAADEAAVFKLWEGLGYYSRARNLHATAKAITEQQAGIFPSRYADILALKGVGAYTAAAIASFAYGLPYAVVDGNVYRVLARYYGIETPIDSNEGKKQFATLAQSLLDSRQAGAYNQAIMDFGAVQCRPAAPLCEQCPMQAQCTARREGTVSRYPVKGKKMRKKIRFFYYLLLNHKGNIQLQKQTAKDIWQGLYVLPHLEMENEGQVEAALEIAVQRGWLQAGQYTMTGIHPVQRQTLTHQQIVATFVEIEQKHNFFLQGDDFCVIERKKIANFALPKIMQWLRG